MERRRRLWLRPLWKLRTTSTRQCSFSTRPWVGTKVKTSSSCRHRQQGPALVIWAAHRRSEEGSKAIAWCVMMAPRQQAQWLRLSPISMWRRKNKSWSNQRRWQRAQPLRQTLKEWEVANRLRWRAKRDASSRRGLVKAVCRSDLSHLVQARFFSEYWELLKANW